MSGVAGKIVPRGNSSLFGTGVDRGGEITVSSSMERRNLGCVQLAAKNPEVVDATVEITPLVRKDPGDTDGKGRVLGRIERAGKFRTVQAEGSVEVDLETVSVGNRKVIPDPIRYPRSRGGMEGILRPGSRINVDLELRARGANLEVVVEGGPALGHQDVVHSVVGGHPHFVGGAVEPEGQGELAWLIHVTQLREINPVVIAIEGDSAPGLAGRPLGRAKNLGMVAVAGGVKGNGAIAFLKGKARTEDRGDRVG